MISGSTNSYRKGKKNVYFSSHFVPIYGHPGRCILNSDNGNPIKSEAILKHFKPIYTYSSRKKGSEKYSMLLMDVWSLNKLPSTVKNMNIFYES